MRQLDMEKVAQLKSALRPRLVESVWLGLRVVLMVFIISAFGWTLQHLDSFEELGKPALGTAAVFMLFLVLVLLLDLIAIGLLLRDMLKPGLFVGINLFQTTFWFIVIVIGLAEIGKTHGEPAGVVFGFFVFLTYLGLFVYSTLEFKRLKEEAARGRSAQANQQGVVPESPAVPLTKTSEGSPQELGAKPDDDAHYAALPHVDYSMPLLDQSQYPASPPRPGIEGQRPTRPAQMV